MRYAISLVSILSIFITGCTPLIIAGKRQSFPEKNITALHEAVRKSNFDRVVQLLDEGADVNTRTTYNRSPLSFAVRNKDSRMSLFLLSKGSDPNIFFYADTKHGDLRATVIHHAIELNLPEVVEALISYGANLKATTDWNQNNVTESTLSTRYWLHKEFLLSETSRSLELEKNLAVLKKLVAAGAPLPKPRSIGIGSSISFDSPAFAQDFALKQFVQELSERR